MSRNYKFMDFSKNKWSWQELLFALENNLISRKDIIKYAIHTLDEGILGFDIVLKIAIADEYEDIFPYFHELISLETFEDASTIKDKWRYVILKELHAKKSDSDDFNSKTEEVYADFGYPEDMAGFIRYMPLTEGKSMEESWQSYLISAKKRFENE
ncbi:DUF2247 family protein [Listeria monocytogenes]|uniref:DUF2247 family protein n=1 Tax=Listeria monocytogenes TaxID=1639 RepID=UPI0034A3EDA1|nr:DUF2247 family protein [Listeria monocytogenes]EIZ6335136.1 DUF2247 family protein [Listeria monocytogenes]EJM2868760.1 DUF2247 family protein [Listeria monocytogenes]